MTLGDIFIVVECKSKMCLWIFLPQPKTHLSSCLLLRLLYYVPKKLSPKKSFFFQPPDYRPWYELGAFLAASHDLLFPAEEKNVYRWFSMFECLISISQKIILQLCLKWPIQCQPSAIANMFFMSLSPFFAL